MTYRITYWRQMCNGEGMPMDEEFTAESDAAAQQVLREWREAHPRREMVTLESVVTLPTP